MVVIRDFYVWKMGEVGCLCDSQSFGTEDEGDYLMDPEKIWRLGFYCELRGGFGPYLVLNFLFRFLF